MYETRSGEVVQIIDARAHGCEFVTHSVDAVVTSGNDDGSSSFSTGRNRTDVGR